MQRAVTQCATRPVTLAGVTSVLGLSGGADSVERIELRCVCCCEASGVPHGYQIEALHGFVEELVVNDDPEYQWIDKIRSMRASNEARQMQFSKLSGNFVVDSAVCASHT